MRGREEPRWTPRILFESWINEGPTITWRSVRVEEAEGGGSWDDPYGIRVGNFRVELCVA